MKIPSLNICENNNINFTKIVAVSAVIYLGYLLIASAIKAALSIATLALTIFVLYKGFQFVRQHDSENTLQNYAIDSIKDLSSKVRSFFANIDLSGI